MSTNWPKWCGSLVPTSLPLYTTAPSAQHTIHCIGERTVHIGERTGSVRPKCSSAMFGELEKLQCTLGQCSVSPVAFQSSWGGLSAYSWNITASSLSNVHLYIAHNTHCALCSTTHTFNLNTGWFFNPHKYQNSPHIVQGGFLNCPPPLKVRSTKNLI